MTSNFCLIAILAVLVSCANNQQPVMSNFSPDINQPDTSKPIIITGFSAKAYPQIFEAAFHYGTKTKEGKQKYRFTAYNMGNIKIETGKVIAFDHIVMHDASPFTQQFPKGEFPVDLAMAKTENDQRVAFSRILFSKNPVTKWEFALHQGQKPISLKDTSIYCYGVDAGTGIFIDSVANIYFNKKDEAEWQNIFVNKTESKSQKGFIEEFDGHSLAVFSTGYGDGCYSTYIGFDSTGNVCQLLTDFGLVGWWKLD